MSKIDASYQKLREGEVARTVEIRTDLLVDVTADGSVIGIERIGGNVEFADLLGILWRARMPAGDGSTEAPKAAEA